MDENMEQPVKKAARKPAVNARPKARAPKIAVYTADGGREIASPETQRSFIAEFNRLPAQQKAGVVWLVQKLTTPPYFTEGYRKMVRFLKLFIKDVPNIKF